MRPPSPQPCAMRRAGLCSRPSLFSLRRPDGRGSGTRGESSPVTEEADIALDTFLKAHLGGSASRAGWLSEETADNPARLQRRNPCLGRRSHRRLARLRARVIPTGPISIALVEGWGPVLGVLYADPTTSPHTRRGLGGGVWCNGERLQVVSRRLFLLIRVRVAGPKPLVDRLASAKLRARSSACLRVPSLALRPGAGWPEGSIDIGLVSPTLTGLGYCGSGSHAA